MAPAYLPLSWNKYLSYIHKLACQILAEGPKFDLIVAVSRGGLTLGHVLSDQLRISIWTIIIQSYTDIKIHGEVKITGKLQTSIKYKRILLVDDVSDSGHTFTRAIRYLKRCHPKSITTLAVFYKPHSVYKPDYYAATTSKWIIFPYEKTEMLLLLAKKYYKNSAWSTQFTQKLRQLNFTRQQIEFVKHYHLKK